MTTTMAMTTMMMTTMTTATAAATAVADGHQVVDKPSRHVQHFGDFRHLSADFRLWMISSSDTPAIVTEQNRPSRRPGL
jgi:hypothetical protein